MLGTLVKTATRAERAAQECELLLGLQGERTSHKERYGDWLYYTRTSAERPADHYLRAKVDGGPEQSVLDINALATNAQGPIEIGKVELRTQNPSGIPEAIHAMQPSQ